MIVTKQDVIAQIERAKRNGLQVKDLSAEDINRITAAANKNIGRIEDEGLWSFVTIRIEK